MRVTVDEYSLIISGNEAEWPDFEFTISSDTSTSVKIRLRDIPPSSITDVSYFSDFELLEHAAE